MTSATSELPEYGPGDLPEIIDEPDLAKAMNKAAEIFGGKPEDHMPDGFTQADWDALGEPKTAPIIVAVDEESALLAQDAGREVHLVATDDPLSDRAPVEDLLAEADINMAEATKELDPRILAIVQKGLDDVEAGHGVTTSRPIRD